MELKSGDVFLVAWFFLERDVAWPGQRKALGVGNGQDKVWW